MTSTPAATAPIVSTPSNTCPDCGVVGLGYVCGSPADPSAGLDCYRRTLTATDWVLSVWIAEGFGRCTTILDDGTFVVTLEATGATVYARLADLVEVEAVRA